jgi:hypothetical protein
MGSPHHPETKPPETQVVLGQVHDGWCRPKLSPEAAGQQ